MEYEQVRKAVAELRKHAAKPFCVTCEAEAESMKRADAAVGLPFTDWKVGDEFYKVEQLTGRGFVPFQERSMSNTPSKGRIVHYTLSQADADQVNRRRTSPAEIAARIGEDKWPLGAQAHIGSAVSAGEQYPMMIIDVREAGELVDGKVELPGTDVLWIRLCRMSDSPGGSQAQQGRWHWPARV